MINPCIGFVDVPKVAKFGGVFIMVDDNMFPQIVHVLGILEFNMDVHTFGVVCTRFERIGWSWGVIGPFGHV